MIILPLTINPKAKKLEVPGIRQFSNQLVHYPDAINLTIGQPDFPTPTSVKEAAIKAIQENNTGYSMNAGILELRKAVNAFFKDTYGFSYDPETEIVITNGASEALDSVFRTIINPGDEVILIAPLYSAYVSLIEMCGGNVVYLDTSDTDFLPSPERLKGLITDKTKAVLFNYPQNPTGATLNKDLMDKLVEVIKDEEIYILSDEVYSENTFIGKHHSFAQYEILRDRLFLIHALSKSHSMTGWRLGYVLGPEALIQQVLKVHLYNSICAPVPSQYGAIEALTNARDVPQEMNVEYRKRLDYVYHRLNDMGLVVNKPNGAFYIFPSIKQFHMKSFDFCTKLLKEGGVATVPGSTFTNYGEGHIRISYAGSMEILEKAMDRLENFIKKF